MLTWAPRFASKIARARPVPREPPVTKQCCKEIARERTLEEEQSELTLPRGSHFLENHMLYNVDVTTRKAATASACNTVAPTIGRESCDARTVGWCIEERRGLRGEWLRESLESKVGGVDGGSRGRLVHPAWTASLNHHDTTTIPPWALSPFSIFSFPRFEPTWSISSWYLVASVVFARRHPAYRPQTWHNLLRPPRLPTRCSTERPPSSNYANKGGWFRAGLFMEGSESSYARNLPGIKIS